MLRKARISTLKSPLRRILARKKRTSCTSPLIIRSTPSKTITRETSELLAKMEVMPATASAIAIAK